MTQRSPAGEVQRNRLAQPQCQMRITRKPTAHRINSENSPRRATSYGVSAVALKLYFYAVRLGHHPDRQDVGRGRFFSVATAPRRDRFHRLDRSLGNPLLCVSGPEDSGWADRRQRVAEQHGSTADRWHRMSVVAPSSSFISGLQCQANWAAKQR